MTEDETCDRIVQEIKAATPFAAHGTEPPRDLAAGYRLQDKVAQRLGGDPAFGAVAGWKIAANSADLMARFGLDEPVSGRVFEGQNHGSPATLTAKDYRQFALEPEIAAVMGATLAPQDAPFDAATVQAAVDRFVPSMELLDMRDVNLPQVHLPDVTAQNISNVGAVTGGPGVAPGDLDLEGLRMTLTVDGEIRHDVTGAAPQHPLEAVAWLANHLAARGLSLEAGQIVLCGTHSPILYHDGSGEIVVEMSGLGNATLRLEG